MTTTAQSASVDTDEAAPANGATAMMGWFPAAATFTVIGYLAARATGPITDPDTWWHLRLGHEFRDGWSIARPGELSPFAQARWVPTQWLTEVVASVMEDFAGLAGVAWLTGLVVLLLGASLWWLCRGNADQLPASIAACSALVGVSSVIAPRPQILSLVLLALFVSAWMRTARDLRPRWWLIPLAWLWASAHGFWFMGSVVGLGVVAGLCLDRRLTSKVAFTLTAVPVGGLLVAALTPAGPPLVLTPFQVSHITAFIQEWAAPDIFGETSNAIVALMVLAVVLTYARRGNSVWVELSLLCLGGCLMLYSERTVALAAVILAPLLASAIQMWVGYGPARPVSRREMRLPVIALCLSALVITLVSVSKAPYQDPYPHSIERTLAALPPSAVVFNDYSYGGWLSWRYPHLVHVVDGMTEAYSPDYLSSYVKATNLEPGWQDFIREVGVTHAFLDDNAPLAAELETHLGWKVLVETKHYVILERPTT